MRLCPYFKRKEVKMEFNQTKTFKNLTAAFAGECQAGMRYQMIAQKALMQGYKTLADEIKTIAKNETMHAKTFFDFILENGAACPNAEVAGGFPFEGDTVENGLIAALNAEKSESEFIYPSFAKDAQDEGYTQIADTFLRVAEVEKRHEIIFAYLAKHFEDGTLFKSDTPVLYECSECGFRFTAKQAFSVCPLCKSSQGFVKLNLPD